MRYPHLPLIAAPLLAFATLAAFSLSPAPAQNPPNITDANSRVTEASKQAIAASVAWLRLLDGKEFAASWDKASAAFRKSITRDDWVKYLRKWRQHLGTVVGRRVLAKDYTTKLPNAPAGEYVMAVFRTDFNDDFKAVETVVVQREGDGAWRVAAYYVR